jgi:hypothetical protein
MGKCEDVEMASGSYNAFSKIKQDLIGFAETNYC